MQVLEVRAAELLLKLRVAKLLLRRVAKLLLELMVAKLLLKQRLGILKPPGGLHTEGNLTRNLPLKVSVWFFEEAHGARGPALHGPVRRSR
jgi:hypothetical protein